MLGEVPAAEPVAQGVVAEMAVMVTPIPMPPPVVELLREGNPAPVLKVTKKSRLAKKKSLPKSMLSRTERHQMALMATTQKTDGPSLLDFFNDEDAQSGASDLDFHRSFSRPKLIEVAVQDEEGDEDIAISDTVKLRLFLARMKAVQAHQKKFS